MARLEMLLLITEFHLSCYLAARILNLPYEESKRNYRVFKREHRVRSQLRNAKNFFDLGSERT